MIRSTATVDTSGIDALIDLVESQDKMVATVGQRVYDRLAPEALSELRHEPGKPKYPLQWTSDKQRKFVMAMLRKDNNLPYPRTGKLAQGWTIKVSDPSGGVFAIVIENPAPAAKFVYGSLAKDANAAKRFQQKFHAETGWRAMSPVVARISDDFVAAFRQEWKTEIQTRRRAFTKGTRRVA